MFCTRAGVALFCGIFLLFICEADTLSPSFLKFREVFYHFFFPLSRKNLLFFTRRDIMTVSVSNAATKDGVRPYARRRGAGVSPPCGKEERVSFIEKKRAVACEDVPQGGGRKP